MKIGVIGAGTMGQGIAKAFAQVEGNTVALCDIKQEWAENGLAKIKKGYEKLVAKGKIPQEKADAIVAAITPGLKENLCADCDLVVEAAFEDMKVKQTTFGELDKICKPECIFASNTSGLSITEMAACIPQRSDKFIGCHFFNPAQIMKLVEVTRALQTSDETFQTAFDLMASLGKTPIAVHEGPGFVVNRILIPMMNEAMGIVADGIASPADVDVAMQLGAGMKSGPLHTADLVGHDVNLAIMETLYHETGDPKYRPHPLMRQMVRAGWLGVKTGKGFFEYDGPFGKEIVK